MCAVRIEQENGDNPRHKGPKFSARECTKGIWSPLNIGLMIAGFIFFTPLGFLIMFALICGVTPWKIPQWIASWFEGMSDWSERAGATYQRRTRSGNEIFDEYQQTQLDRIDEIRTEVKERDSQFKSFKGDEQKAKDKKQFDPFMGRDPEVSA